ncbi:response regulator [Caminibacter mediatlanticus]|uniref:DNA-binding response regulator, putative n=1 Tax=Caminibacter mediatlanticus TB-2 TaxID=391592 RepID=A0AAI9AIE3_9BACT|nr:response regulator [Caminibacter mediatlanticus]EDM24074.1 DNA-binding response regulator, putative [Caminibacter mediatlanticus TB-2]
MKIIIVENEIYLAQSIQNNLTEKLKANCEIYGSFNEALESNGDIYIVNTNLEGNLNNFIEEKKDKIIILLVPYVTYSNVTNPLNIGADDYLQKPFTIEELIRKIKHLREYYTLKEKVKKLESFIEFVLKDIELSLPSYSFPIFLKSTPTKTIEKFIYEVAKKENALIEIIDLTKFKEKHFNNKDKLYFCLNYDKVEDEEILNFISKFKSVILLPKNYDKINNILEIEANAKNFFDEEILSIEEYIKFIIKTHQHKFPDTELSKKLGISRKSLWEKRKKYGIFKQK